MTDTKNKLTDLCGNRLLQNDFKNTCEITSQRRKRSEVAPSIPEGSVAKAGKVRYRGTSLITSTHLPRITTDSQA